MGRPIQPLENPSRLLSLEGETLDREIARLIKENPPRLRRWTEKEILVLKRLWGKVPGRVVARTLGRGYGVVKSKASALGLSDDRS